jgi:hypothetical protein
MRERRMGFLAADKEYVRFFSGTAGVGRKRG